MYKQLNEFKEDTSKQQNEFKENSNHHLNEVNNTLQDMKD
jgi:hypothetical protein